jgi:hypothetical protein
MDTTTLKEIVKQEMKLYAKKGLNAYSYLTINEDGTVLAVIDVATIKGKQIVDAPLIARLVGEQIYIDRDQNNKPLVDALKARGIPENQIVLGYRDDMLTAKS